MLDDPVDEELEEDELDEEDELLEPEVLVDDEFELDELDDELPVELLEEVDDFESALRESVR